MVRYLSVVGSMLVLGLVSVASAFEIEVDRVTPEYLKANPDLLQVKASERDGIVTFEIRLRLTEPQYVTWHLTTDLASKEQREVFTTAAAVTESATSVTFQIPLKSIGDHQLQLGVGGFNLKEGVAIPWLGGTTYVFKLQDFARGPFAPAPQSEGGRGGGESGAGGTNRGGQSGFGRGGGSPSEALKSGTAPTAPDARDSNRGGPSSFGRGGGNPSEALKSGPETGAPGANAAQRKGIGFLMEHSGTARDAGRFGESKGISVGAFVRVHKSVKANDVAKLVQAFARLGILAPEFAESETPDCVVDLLCPESFPQDGRDRLERELRGVVEPMAGKWTVRAVTAKPTK